MLTYHNAINKYPPCRPIAKYPRVSSIFINIQTYVRAVTFTAATVTAATLKGFGQPALQAYFDRSRGLFLDVLVQC